jgi:hypothetical protein
MTEGFLTTWPGDEENERMLAIYLQQPPAAQQISCAVAIRFKATMEGLSGAVRTDPSRCFVQHAFSQAPWCSLPAQRKVV